MAKNPAAAPGEPRVKRKYVRRNQTAAKTPAPAQAALAALKPADVPAIVNGATPKNMVEVDEQLLSDVRMVLFVAETVAHTRGLEREYLPIVDRLRKAFGTK